MSKELTIHPVTNGAGETVAWAVIRNMSEKVAEFATVEEAFAFAYGPEQKSATARTVTAASEVRPGDILHISDYENHAVERVEPFKCGDGEQAFQYHLANGGRTWNRASDSVYVTRAV